MIRTHKKRLETQFPVKMQHTAKLRIYSPPAHNNQTKTTCYYNYSTLPIRETRYNPGVRPSCLLLFAVSSTKWKKLGERLCASNSIRQ